MTAVPPPTLGAATVPTAALLHRRTLTETGIVHLGLGNFHRAHQAVYPYELLKLRLLNGTRGRPRRGRRQSPPLTGAHRVTDRHHHDRSADADPRGHAVRRP